MKTRLLIFAMLSASAFYIAAIPGNLSGFTVRVNGPDVYHNGTRLRGFHRNELYAQRLDVALQAEPGCKLI